MARTQGFRLCIAVRNNFSNLACEAKETRNHHGAGDCEDFQSLRIDYQFLGGGMVNDGIRLYAKEITRNWKEVVRFFLIEENFEDFKKWHFKKYGKGANICNFTRFF